MAVPPANSAPVTGALDAQTFRNIAKATTPAVVNIRTEMKAKSQDLTDFFGGGGGGAPDDFLHRFFGAPGGGQDDQGQGGGRSRRAPTTVAAGTGFVISAKDGADPHEQPRRRGRRQRSRCRSTARSRTRPTRRS